MQIRRKINALVQRYTLKRIDSLKERNKTFLESIALIEKPEYEFTVLGNVPDTESKMAAPLKVKMPITSGKIVLGGVSTKNYRTLQQLNKSIAFWEKVLIKFSSDDESK